MFEGLRSYLVFHEDDKIISADEILPDFCSASTVLNVILLALLFSIMITLLSRPLATSLLQDFALITLFVQWLGLSCVAILCRSRRFLKQLSADVALFATFCIIVATTIVISEAGVWLLYFAGMTSSARPDWYVYFHVQNLVVSGIAGALVMRYFIARDQLRRRALQAVAAKQELQRYRIRKHFVYNSMNTIAGLTLQNPDQVENAVEDTADLIRRMLDDSRTLVGVKQEIDLADKYLKMEGHRLQDRLRVKWLAKKFPLGAKTPTLMLQLLIEFAIQYGVELQPNGGEISIDIKTENNDLKTTIEFATPDTDSVMQSEILENIRQQLRNHYNDLGSLSLEVLDTISNVSVTVSHPLYGVDR